MPLGWHVLWLLTPNGTVEVEVEGAAVVVEVPDVPVVRTVESTVAHVPTEPPLKEIALEDVVNLVTKRFHQRAPVWMEKNGHQPAPARMDHSKLRVVHARMDLPLNRVGKNNVNQEKNQANANVKMAQHLNPKDVDLDADVEDVVEEEVVEVVAVDVVNNFSRC